MEQVKLVQNASKQMHKKTVRASVSGKTITEISIEDYFRKKYQGQIERVFSNVWNFFTDVAIKNGYEERDGQQDMAYDIVDCLKDKEHIAVEAGVGIGKSFGYLIPLSYLHNEMDRPIAISTSTIALQEQLADDIKEVFRMTGHDAEVVLAKGQTHFLCKRRASEYKQDEKIKRLSESGYTERKDISFSIENAIWNKINVQYNFKDCNICKFKQKCHYFYLRERMYNTKGFILCNHDLLIAHLKKVHSNQRLLLNGEIAVRVIDEAHNLEDKVRKSYTLHYGERVISDISIEVRKGIKTLGTNIANLTENLLSNTKLLYKEFNAQIKSQIESGNNDLKDAERFFLNRNDLTVKLLNKQLGYLKGIDNIIQLYYDDDGRGTETMRQAVESFDELFEFFVQVVNLNENLAWLERGL